MITFLGASECKKYRILNTFIKLHLAANLLADFFSSSLLTCPFQLVTAVSVFVNELASVGLL